MTSRPPAYILIVATILCELWSCMAWTNSLTPKNGLNVYGVTIGSCGNKKALGFLSRRKTTVLHSTNHPNSFDATTTTTRRSWLLKQSTSAAAAILGVCSTSLVAPPSASFATTTSEAVVTDRIFLDVKGLGQPGTGENKRIVIGLFGKEAPRSTKMLKQLVTPREGLPAPCKPRAERTLQKEQLEANKVYNSCIESEKNGVTYDYSQIWRVLPNERIEVGAVTGKFIAREYPTWHEESNSGLKHDSFGLVSVRKGSDGGFGFTIFSGEGSGSAAASLLDEEQIVVGRVENLDIVQELNGVSVIRNKGLTGGPALKSAPSRACTYGGTELYCNEYKPLTKLTILNSGVL